MWRAVSSVLADMGREGSQLVQSRLAEVRDASEKMLLRDSLEYAAKTEYRPILQYPLSEAERNGIRGCR